MFPKYLEDMILPLLEDLNTPRSLTVKLLIEHGEFDQLVNLTVDPAQYLNSHSFYKDSVATELLRKCNMPIASIDRTAVALEGFYAAEKQCYVTNERLLPILRSIQGFYPLDPVEWHLRDFLLRVRKRIARILGRLPAFIDGRHGPGATYSDKGVSTTLPHKMSSRPSVTHAARCFLPFWERTFWFRALAEELPNRSDPLSVPGNRFTTVPKDATKDRGIAIEPSLNVFFQLGIGRVLRQRLLKAGFDLDEGQDLHRRIAREASISGALSTIDLSSASDTVAYHLVKILLPDDWFSVLDALRSPTTLVEGKRHRLQKFSSMGNGFTFELETLIFSQICEEVCSHVQHSCVYCYGDDLIVPSEAASEVLLYLRACGFTPNQRKTFTSGPFRESCGGDFFNGVPVRAHYLKEFPDSPEKLISLVNGVRRSSRNAGYPDDTFYSRFRRKVLAAIPSDIRRLKGPEALGDLVIHDDNPMTWSKKFDHGIRYIRVYRPISRSLSLNRFSGLVVLASALYGVPSSGPVPRGQVLGYRKSWSAFS